MRPLLNVYRNAFRGLPRDVWRLAAGALVNRAGTMVLPFLALWLTQERGFSVVAAGRLLALYGVGAAFGAYMGGRLSDRIGPWRAQQLSLFLGGAGFLMMSQAEGPLAVTIVILLTSLMAESFRPAVMAATAECLTPGAEVRAFSLLRLALNLGMSIGPAVGGFLALYSYRWLFVADAVTCWLAIPIVRPPAGEHLRRKERAKSAGKGRSPFADGPFLVFLGLVMLLAAVLFQAFSTLPLTFRDVYGMRENAIGALLGFNAGIIVLFEMLLASAAERMDRTRLLATGAFLLCAGLGLLPFGGSLIWAFFTVAVWTVGEMLCLPILNVVVARRADPASRGRYMGAYGMAFAAAFVFAPALGTWIYGRFGADILWYSVGSLAPLLTLAAWTWGRRFDRPALATRPLAP